jgi:SAM-dependent methyltransferase
MVTGTIVEHEPGTEKYFLPEEHAAVLTRASAADNMAAFAQYVAVIGGVEDRIVECFKKGGGVAYEEFDRFHEVMAEDSGQSVIPALLDHILPLAPGLTDRLRSGIDVLDVGCGSGRALNLMAHSFPESRFFGFDISEEAVDRGRTEAEGLKNLAFEVRDATEMGIEERFDLITTFDAVHDQAAPERVLEGIQKALRPDGVYLMQDIDASHRVHENMDHPLGPFLYTISTMHCMTVSLARNGAGLGTMWGVETAKTMLRQAGFTDIQIHRLAHDPQNCYFLNRKG